MYIYQLCKEKCAILQTCWAVRPLLSRAILPMPSANTAQTMEKFYVWHIYMCIHPLYMHVKYLAYKAYMSYLVGIFISGIYVAIMCSRSSSGSI